MIVSLILTAVPPPAVRRIYETAPAGERLPRVQVVVVSTCSRQVNDFRGLFARDDGLQAFVPSLERKRLSLKHVGVHIMAHQRPRVLAARLMTDDRSNQIERYPHLRQHGRERSSKVVATELGDR
jgi:hypothetical protein